ncbi:MAG: hypothetical protein JWM27_2631, partial [Gemmatimonadetes bacterium]|nr:hypothetical protein [Gemmatimonadota bacterium]
MRLLYTLASWLLLAAAAPALHAQDGPVPAGLFATPGGGRLAV